MGLESVSLVPSKTSSLLVILETSRCDDVSAEFDLYSIREESTRSRFERSISTFQSTWVKSFTLSTKISVILRRRTSN